MEKKIEVTAKVTLDAITTLEDLERFVATARQVLDRPEVMLVAVGAPKTAQPATSAPEAPKVPDRIEEWPEDDEHLRPFLWKNRYGGVWQHTGAGWNLGDSPNVRNAPMNAPFTREEGAGL